MLLCQSFCAAAVHSSCCSCVSHQTASPPSPTGCHETRRGSLKVNEFVVIEPEEAGMPSNEYCLQDDSRPRLFYPFGSIWSKRTLLGKAVTSLVSSISTSRNRAIIVPCRNSYNGKESNTGDAAGEVLVDTGVVTELLLVCISIFAWGS